MHLYATLFLLGCLVAVAAAQPLVPCTYTTPDGAEFDFSRLAEYQLTRAGAQSDAYAVNICGAANVNSFCQSSDAGVCFHFTWSPDWFALGRTITGSGPAPVFSEAQPGMPGEGIVLTYNNGMYGSNPATMEVMLLCGSNLVPEIDNIQHDSAYHWSANITSSINCPLPTPPPSSDCSYTFGDGSHFDFSALTTRTGTVVKGTQSDVYNINVCGVAQGDGSAGVCVQNKATACFQFTWSPDWFAIADLNAQSPPTWSQIEEGNPSAGVQMVYANGMYGPNPATVTYQFFCSQTAGPAVYTATHGTSFNWNITVTSTEACQVGASSPLPSLPPNPVHKKVLLE